MSGFIDLNTWKRREHFSLYRGLANPFWSICADVDVTRVWESSRQTEDRSFALAVIHLGITAANEIEAFRLRLRGDKVWLHDRVDISTTILRADETFSFAIYPTCDRFGDFERLARAESEVARAGRPLQASMPTGDDVIYHSTMPWIRFTGCTNAVGGPDDSIPRIVFGRCTKEAGRWLMPVAVEVHHALVDGLDVARFFEGFERGIAAFDW